jgi:hypothetical protein
VRDEKFARDDALRGAMQNRRRRSSLIATAGTLWRRIFSRGVILFQIALTPRAPFC